jgi:glucokinase
MLNVISSPTDAKAAFAIIGASQGLGPAVLFGN